jgi:predicted dehydrogenase
MTVRIIQVGLGLWGRDWAANVLPRLPEVEVVAWADADPRALALADEVADPPAGGSHASLDEALERVDAHAVLATVAIPAHTEVALTALRAGRHLLLEKPFAATMAEAHLVVAEAEARGLVLSIAQNYRFLPAVAVVTELIKAGSLGPVHRVGIDFRKDHRTDARTSRSPLDHSLITQIGIHHFDLVRAVVGREPLAVYCRAWSPSWAAGPGLVSAAALLELEGGAVVGWAGSLRSAGPETSWAGDWLIELERGAVAWHTDADGREVGETSEPGRPARRIAVPPAAPHADRVALLAGFLAAVRDGVAAPSAGADNLRSLAVMAAALDSAARRRPVEVEARR